MVSIYDVPANELIEKTTEKLKKMPELAPPEWAAYVKTGAHKERPPSRKDWWYVRTASILRVIYKQGPIGVSKLRRRYSGRKNRGTAPDKTYKGSGNIIRKILQKLEIVELVKQSQKGIYKGRIITPKGKSFLDKIAGEIYEPLKKDAKKSKKKKKGTKKKSKKKETSKKKEDKKTESKKKGTKKKSKKKKTSKKQDKKAGSKKKGKKDNKDT
ncbi:30S ribosomal protein S19e [Candidatus Woesearchaeota archaeon]|nr:30S ribosomal protein S19e [Candidatus Woesearchaeota archaeon]